MNQETASAEKMQGQLIATHVLLEAILRTLPARSLKEIVQQHKRIGDEVEGHLLNTPSSDLMLAAYHSNLENTAQLLSKIQQDAIFRDSAQGTL